MKRFVLSLLFLFQFFVFSFDLEATRIAVIYAGVGDREAAQRIHIACENLGIDCELYEFEWGIVDNFDYEKVEMFKPDFILTTTNTCITPMPSCAPNYGVLYLPSTYYSESNTFLKRQVNELLSSLSDFDGLMTTSSIPPKNALIQCDIHSLLLPFRWYPTAQDRGEYVSEPKSLFYCGSNWDKTRNSKKFKQVFKNLSKNNYFNIYGPKEAWKHLLHVYKGYIPSDGENLLEVMSQHGIALILHPVEYIQEGVPTGRIFETVAAGCICICDRNPFVQEFFGDNVLYIDESASAHTITRQINEHMQWIYQNPQEAKEKAARAQQIFRECFLLEDQINNLVRWHLESKQTK